VKPQINFDQLPTEQNNPRTRRIDQLGTPQILSLINREDFNAARAVQRARPSIAKATNLLVNSLRGGGRLFLLGAGTSGRLGVLEAAECPPTFNTPPGSVEAFMAGGRASVFKSKEGAEDRGQDAARIVKQKVRAGDVVVGIAASGVTTFVKEGLHAAKARKARTIFLTCNPRHPLRAEVCIVLDTGAEVISGSTRLKAATATKMALNALTVAAMVQLGKVYGNHMVDLQPKSKKLKARAVRLIRLLGRVSQIQAEKLLQESGGNAKTAILMARRKIGRAEATALLKRINGHLHKALSAII